MNCATHQQTPAVAYCRTCGKPLCEGCKREVHGIIYCEECLASHVQAAPVVANPSAPHPGVALALGFIPGVGAMYTGEFKKAFIHVAVFVALIVAANELSDYFAILFPFWFFYMVFDSYHTAKAKQEGRPVPDILGFGFGNTSTASAASAAPAPATAPAPTSLIDTRTPIPVFPIVLIGLGVLLLLHTLGWLPFFHLGKLWFLIPLGIGAWQVWQRSQRVVCQCVACTANWILAPAMWLTFGLIGMLHELTRIHFLESWPLLVIVFGVVKFLQSNGSRAGHIVPGVAAAETPPANAAAPSEQNEVSHG